MIERSKISIKRSALIRNSHPPSLAVAWPISTRPDFQRPPATSGEAPDLDPSDLYDVRWLHVARAKSQQDDAQELAHKGPRVIRPKIMISSIGFRGPD